MRTYTWDEYYEKFYDWAESTRVKNLSYLVDLVTRNLNADYTVTRMIGY